MNVLDGNSDGDLRTKAKGMLKEMSGVYPALAHVFSLLLLFFVAIVLTGIVKLMQAMIYFASYVFPLIGVVFVGAGGSIVAGGNAKIGIVGGFMGLIIMGIGSFFYTEFLLGRGSELPPITEIL